MSIDEWWCSREALEEPLLSITDPRVLAEHVDVSFDGRKFNLYKTAK